MFIFEFYLHYTLLFKSLGHVTIRCTYSKKNSNRTTNLLNEQSFTFYRGFNIKLCLNVI